MCDVVDEDICDTDQVQRKTVSHGKPVVGKGRLTGGLLLNCAKLEYGKRPILASSAAAVGDEEIRQPRHALLSEVSALFCMLCLRLELRKAVAAAMVVAAASASAAPAAAHSVLLE
jgi:hypothetical protein